MFYYLQLQENILFITRYNKYTIFLYKQNAQFTKLATKIDLQLKTLQFSLQSVIALMVIVKGYSFFYLEHSTPHNHKNHRC